MSAEAAKKIPADFAVRCRDLANCGWGYRPSVNAAHTARAYVTPGTPEHKTGCARCGGAMQIVTAHEFATYAPAAAQSDDPS